MKLQQADWYHHLPPQGKEILQKLQGAGFIAYIVGGAVRDLLLHKAPKDYDFVTNATPTELSALFAKTLDIGKQFGITIVVLDEKPFEVATFRKDGEYKDSRHPEEVLFATPEEDALRRDFSMNGLFWDPVSKNIIDYVDGIDAIDRKEIQTIGSAEKRFQEDALRMLRALRFYSQLAPKKFQLHEEVRSAIRELKNNLKNVSKERITQEMKHVILSPKPSLALQEIVNLELWDLFFPFPAPSFSPLARAYMSWQSAEAVPESYFWSLLFPEDLSLDESAKSFILSKNTKSEIKSIFALQEKIAVAQNLSKPSLKLLLQNADFFSAASGLLAKNKLTDEANFCIAKYKEFSEANSLNPSPLLTGKDLETLGYQPGKKFQEILMKIREEQLDENISSKEQAIHLVKKLFP